jgi:hypothetical protein
LALAFGRGRAVAFLVDPDAGYITGAIIPLDCGDACILCDATTSLPRMSPDLYFRPSRQP